MRIHNSDKIIAWMALFSGLTISAVAIWYSVAGLVSIFAAAVTPIIVMGVALEISKLIATVWLKINWKRAPVFIRTYLLIAIMVLMVITSMGIFGFLSKAHSDQSLVSGDVQAKIAVYDEKIKTEKDNIEANRKALKQMDEGVDQVLGRSTDEKGADKAVALRRSQQKERSRLQNEISQSQKSIAELSDARAPIAAEVRKVEAEVGPIKYIAKLIYEDNPDANVLEKAVTWVILIIVAVFDPLAVILLLASQYSFQWFRKEEEGEDETEGDSPVGPEVVVDEQPPTVTTTTLAANDVTWPEIPKSDPHPIGWMYPKHASIQEYRVEDADDEVPATKPLEGEEALQVLKDTGIVTPDGNLAPEYGGGEVDEDDEIVDNAPHSEKEAMAAWKKDHPDSSLKLQRQMLEKGIIDHLPWEDYIMPKTDEAAEEAKKWADENPQTEEAQAAQQWADEKILTAGFDERPGDYLPENQIAWMEHDKDGNQIKKTKDSYTQNAEQSESTLWQRIQDSKK